MLMSLVFTALAFAGETVIIEDGKIHKIEEKGAYLGVYMDELTGKWIKKLDYPRKEGVLVLEVIEDSPAAKAGLEKHDVIYMFDGQVVEDSDQLRKLVREKEPGDEVTLVIYRDGKKMKVGVELDQHSKKFITIKGLGDDFQIKDIGRLPHLWGTNADIFMNRVGAGGMMLGVKILDMDEDLAGYFGVKKGEGVLVIGVTEDMPAAKAGMKSGDVIVKIDDEEISSAPDVREAMSALEEEEVAEVTVIRKGKEVTFKVEVEKAKGLHWFTFSDDFDRMGVFKLPYGDLDEIKIQALSKDKDAKKLQDIIEELEGKIKKLEERLRKLEED